VGSLVNHTRFGRGKVLKIEGTGNDRKAEIQFDKGDIKKLLLRFAKLELL
jgi:DNA helicase-2/ATP-dependent DNA helicase PcrA